MRTCENRVRRRIFGPKTERVTEGSGKLRKEELHNLYASPNIIVIKCRRMRWVGHTAGMGEMRNAYKTSDNLTAETTWETQAYMKG
jgi:hypothetical protein